MIYVWFNVPVEKKNEAIEQKSSRTKWKKSRNVIRYKDLHVYNIHDQPIVV